MNRLDKDNAQLDSIRCNLILGNKFEGFKELTTNVQITMEIKPS